MCSQSSSDTRFNSRTVIKSFLLLCVLGGLILLIVYFVGGFSISRHYDSDNGKEEFNISEVFNNPAKFKFILQWTRPDREPFAFMGKGRNGFINRDCAFTNCVVTANRSLLSDLSKYDVILFHGPELVYVPIPNKNFPTVRSPRQKYVFGSMESSHYYPICSNRFDGMFNWTWTYKIDSDATWGYILIKDKNNAVIGPNKTMHWLKLEDMDTVSEDFKRKLKSKSKAAAWFVSNCNDKSGRFTFAKQLKTELAEYGLDLDIFGRCGTMSCERSRDKDCDKMVADKYYFYLSFENSFSEDYVTEKLLRALKNDAVPVVYGGANYTRFMPDGIYLNARELGPKLLAASMHKLIQDPDQYIKYFKWKNHYSYHSRREEPENNDYCHFCEMLNDENLMKTETTIRNFREWWDPPGVC